MAKVSNSKKEATVAELEEQLALASHGLETASKDLQEAEAAFDDEVTPATTENLAKARAHRALQVDLHGRASRLLSAARAAAAEAARATLRARLEELEAEFDEQAIQVAIEPIERDEAQALAAVAEVRARRDDLRTHYLAKIAEMTRIREQLDEVVESGPYVDPESGRVFLRHVRSDAPERLLDHRPVVGLVEAAADASASRSVASHLRALAPNASTYRVR